MLYRLLARYSRAYILQSMNETKCIINLRRECINNNCMHGQFIIQCRLHVYMLIHRLVLAEFKRNVIIA